jgi:hypothetical protein
MTTTVTAITKSAIMALYYRALTDTIGLAAILLLFALLTARELLRAADEARWRPAIQALAAAIRPLVLMFCVIVAARFAVYTLHIHLLR